MVMTGHLLRCKGGENERDARKGDDNDNDVGIVMKYMFKEKRLRFFALTRVLYELLLTTKQVPSFYENAACGL